MFLYLGEFFVPSLGTYIPGLGTYVSRLGTYIPRLGTENSPPGKNFLYSVEKVLGLTQKTKQQKTHDKHLREAVLLLLLFFWIFFVFSFEVLLKKCNFAAINALVVELVDTPDLGSGAERRVSSSLIRRT